MVGAPGHVRPCGRVVARVPISVEYCVFTGSVCAKIFCGGCFSVIGGRLHGASQACGLKRGGPAIKSPVCQGVADGVVVQLGIRAGGCTGATVDSAIWQSSIDGIVVLRAPGEWRTIPPPVGHENVVGASAAQVGGASRAGNRCPGAVGSEGAA